MNLTCPDITRSTELITFYGWNTSNGYKISIALAEMGLEHKFVPVDITKDVQFEDWFVKLTLNSKMPVLVHERDAKGPLTIFESGAILEYLAQLTGKFWPVDMDAQMEARQWMYWQMAGLGPMLGQVHHFVHRAPNNNEYSKTRYVTEGKRLYGVLDRRLEGREFILDDYSIVDMMCWPWIMRFEKQTIDITDFPNVACWQERIAGRSGVRQGMEKLDLACS